MYCTVPVEVCCCLRFITIYAQCVSSFYQRETEFYYIPILLRLLIIRETSPAYFPMARSIIALFPAEKNCSLCLKSSLRHWQKHPGFYTLRHCQQLYVVKKVEKRAVCAVGNEDLNCQRGGIFKGLSQDV